MRSPSLISRIDQVDELTRGIRLPLPVIAWPHLNVIYQAVTEAWFSLASSFGNDLRNKKETELNSLVQSQLNNLRLTNIPLSQLVACVVRGGESISYDGSHLEKRPDLALYLTSRHANFPLTIECKIIDRVSGKSIELYCSAGLKRFVDGEYGWANQQGLMIGYVFDGSVIEHDLSSRMLIIEAATPTMLRTDQMPSAIPLSKPATLASRHRRMFKYVGSISGKPGAIEISHLWFQLPNKGQLASRKKKKASNPSIRGGGA